MKSCDMCNTAAAWYVGVFDTCKWYCDAHKPDDAEGIQKKAYNPTQGGQVKDGARIFGMKGSEAVAIYMACVTVLGMMKDENIQHDSRDALENALVRWHAFCEARGVELPKPAAALKTLRMSSEVKIL